MPISSRLRTVDLVQCLFSFFELNVVGEGVPKNCEDLKKPLIMVRFAQTVKSRDPSDGGPATSELTSFFCYSYSHCIPHMCVAVACAPDTLSRIACPPVHLKLEMVMYHHIDFGSSPTHVCLCIYLFGLSLLFLAVLDASLSTCSVQVQYKKPFSALWLFLMNRRTETTDPTTRTGCLYSACLYIRCRVWAKMQENRRRSCSPTSRVRDLHV